MVGRGNIGRLAFLSASEVIGIRGTHEANVAHQSGKPGQQGIKDIDPKLLKKYVTKIWNKDTSYLSSKPLSKGNVLRQYSADSNSSGTSKTSFSIRLLYECRCR